MFFNSKDSDQSQETVRNHLTYLSDLVEALIDSNDKAVKRIDKIEKLILSIEHKDKKPLSKNSTPPVKLKTYTVEQTVKKLAPILNLKKSRLEYLISFSAQDLGIRKMRTGSKAKFTIKDVERIKDRIIEIIKDTHTEIFTITKHAIFKNIIEKTQTNMPETGIFYFVKLAEDKLNIDISSQGKKYSQKQAEQIENFVLDMLNKK